MLRYWSHCLTEIHCLTAKRDVNINFFASVVCCGNVCVCHGFAFSLFYWEKGLTRSPVELLFRDAFAKNFFANPRLWSLNGKPLGVCDTPREVENLIVYQSGHL